MKKTTPFLLLFLFFSTTAILGQKILFIGNSLTYTNGLPLILEEIGDHYNKKIITEMISHPNYAIVDHLNEGTIQQKIAAENYDYVIIQQGPSSQEEGRKMLIDSGAILSKLCKKINTKLGYLMVWPSKKHYFTFDKVIANHTEAAKTNEALLFPVGKYWKQYNMLKNKISLYENDAFHPSKAGSFLAALVVFKKLYPKESIQQIPFKKVSFWVEHQESYIAMLNLLGH
jgi:hypothetical protein